MEWEWEWEWACEGPEEDPGPEAVRARDDEGPAPVIAGAATDVDAAERKEEIPLVGLETGGADAGRPCACACAAV